ncbi:MAG: ribulose-phosphate 3-epimerase [Saccharofermentanales bacterium]|jgi:ribulose-phosphate 3-epimerase|nr:ribulose-phosphate 3-epimerase [Clostridiaceae bacterium]
MLPTYQETAGRLLLCPSILSADFAALGDAMDQVATAADIVHIDVMDGHFVPNLTIGPPVVASLGRRTKLPLDVHLMVEQPINWIEPFAGSGADSLVVHAEACVHLLRCLQMIRDVGCTPGVAINPGTPLTAIEEALPYVDMVLLMTVNPGFGGQQFIPTMTDKIRRLRQRLDDLDRPIHLQIDGGVYLGNIRELYQAGANMIVVGQAVYGQPDPAAALRALRACAV